MERRLDEERLNKLVDNVRADKEEHFEQLYAELLPLVYYRSLVLVNDRDDAQKVTQACFVHLYKHIGELKNTEYFLAWLNAVITSACRGVMQSRRREQDISVELGKDMLADLLGGNESFAPDEALEAHEADERVWAAIQGLTQKQKEAILLYYIEGLSVGDIAGVLGLSYTAAKSRLFKARKRLLVLLTEDEQASAVAPANLGLDSALRHMDTMLIMPFFAHQLTHFELSPRFGELGASLAQLIPTHNSLLSVSATVWNNIFHELGLPVLKAAPALAGTAISVAQASATGAHAAALPGAGKTLLTVLKGVFANPAQTAVVGVASVACVAGVVAGGMLLAKRPPQPPAAPPATSSPAKRVARAPEEPPAPQDETQPVDDTPQKITKEAPANKLPELPVYPVQHEHPHLAPSEPATETPEPDVLVVIPAPGGEVEPLDPSIPIGPFMPIWPDPAHPGGSGDSDDQGQGNGGIIPLGGNAPLLSGLMGL